MRVQTQNFGSTAPFFFCQVLLKGLGGGNIWSFKSCFPERRLKAVEGEIEMKRTWKISEEGGGFAGGGSVMGKEEEDPATVDDPNHALKVFLDRIPISSIPGIQNSSVLELKPSDSIRDAIALLHQKDVFAAPIADGWATEDRNFSDHNIGVVDLASMILWCMEEIEKSAENFDKEGDDLFSALDKLPQIGQATIRELAKSFRWASFLPAYPDDTLLHVLLLLSKHQLKAVPIISHVDSRVIGFLTQNAVLHLLLQCSGLNWFDRIADKALCEFRFEMGDSVVHVNGDQSVAEALHQLWENRLSGIPILDRTSKRLIGALRITDIPLLLDDSRLFSGRKEMTVMELIDADAMRSSVPSSPEVPIEGELGALLSAGTLHLKSAGLPKMNFVVTNQRTDRLKQAMEKLVHCRSDRSFLVEKEKIVGVVTIRDILMQFSPPADANVGRGGFFQSALHETGCHDDKGNPVVNR
ncbi:SNF1-related protein kinase regulatory subunit gamma-1-like isoform X1 [Nymphaea colorata]|nr:SNF1-related protein kinase regulatory subunit gamma-1-like isoform X1 [Nymphaea colorata]